MKIMKKLQTSETTYDLFSVIIHTGSTHQGHYHAYIKDIQNEGTCFDDQFSEKRKKMVQKQLGMILMINMFIQFKKLIYKNNLVLKIVKKVHIHLFIDHKIWKNIKIFVIKKEIPEFLKEEIKLLNEKAKKDKEESDYEDTIYKMHIYIPEFFCVYGEYLYPTNYDYIRNGGETYKFIEAPKATLVKDFKQILRKKFGEDKIPEKFLLYYLERQPMMTSSDRYRFNCGIEDDEKTLLKAKHITNRIHLLAASEQTLKKKLKCMKKEKLYFVYKFILQQIMNLNQINLK